MSALITLTSLGFAWPGQAELLDIPSFHLERGESLFLKGLPAAARPPCSASSAACRSPAAAASACSARTWKAVRRAPRPFPRRPHRLHIFQQFNLLPFLSVRENVELPCHFSALRRQRARERHGSPAQAASHLLGQLGLGGELHERRADSLSIGQQQRVAAARALIGQPELVIADEPTSALDADSREAFLQLLFAECREAGASLLFVSHDQSLAGLFDRSLSLSDLNRAARPAGL